MNIRTASRRHCARDDGAAAVEMALVLPILVVLLLGIMEFGFVFNAQIALTQAVREGVRVGAIGDDPDDPSVALMGTRMQVAYTGIVGDKPTVEEATACAPDDTEGQAELTGVLADFKTPIVRFGPLTLRGTAVMRCGG